MKYRKKPIEVEAFRVGIDEVPYWDNLVSKKYIRYFKKGGWIAEHGDWIVNDNGYLYPVKHDIFIETYEAVE